MDYRDGFEDGVKFAREVIINNIRKWALDAEESSEASYFDIVADKIEFGTLDNDA